MTSGKGEPPPLPAPPYSNQHPSTRQSYVHGNIVPENRPLTQPITTKQPVYTVEDSLRDFPTAPNRRFMIQLHLVPNDPNHSSFKTYPWTDCIKTFLGIVKTVDDDFHILKKHSRPATRNAITTQAQFPTSITDFEHDFAYDVIVPKSMLYAKVKLVVASNHTYDELFKGSNNKIFRQIRKCGWWINDMKASTQGNQAQIGWVKHAHPMYVNQQNFLQSINTVFGDITPHLDVICKWEKKTYKTPSGETKRMKVRVLSILCPRDIAKPVSDIMFARWLGINDPNNYWYDKAMALRNYLFIPYRKTVQFTAEAQILHLLEHGQWLQQHNDVVYLDKLTSIDTPFVVTEYLLQHMDFHDDSMLGKEITLRSLLTAWSKVDSNGTTLPAVTAIEKIDETKYALLTHVHSVYELYNDVCRAVDVMSTCEGWDKLCGHPDGAVVTSPKVNPLLTRNAYLDAAVNTSTGISAMPVSPNTSLFNSDYKNPKVVRNPYKQSTLKNKSSTKQKTIKSSSLQRQSKAQSNDTTAFSYAAAVSQQGNNSSQSNNKVTNYVTPQTLQQELQLLRDSFTGLAQSICSEVCTEMINPVVHKIDNTNQQVNSIKNDLHQLSDFKQEIQQQSTALEKKLEHKLDQILQALQCNAMSGSSHHNSFNGTNQTNSIHKKDSSTTIPPSPDKQPHSTFQQSSLQQAKSPRRSSSEKLNMLNAESEDDEYFSYTPPNNDIIDMTNIDSMEVDNLTGKKRHNNEISEGQVSPSSAASTNNTASPSSSTHFASYTSNSVTNSNCTNTTVYGAQAPEGTHKPSGVFISAQALMTAHSIVSKDSGAHRGKYQ